MMMKTFKHSRYASKRKINLIYKMIDVLCLSVPIYVEETLRTKLLFKALKLIKEDEALIFVSLRNMKMSVLKVKKENMKTTEFIDNQHETEDCYGKLYIEDRSSELCHLLNTSLTKQEKKLISGILIQYSKGQKMNLVKVGKKLNVNRQRASKILKDIRSKREEPEDMYRVRGVDELFNDIPNN